MKTLSRKQIEARSTRALTDVREALRANVLARRAQFKLSQSDLAIRARVARPVLSKIETANGDFQVSALAKLAAALDCDVAELLSYNAGGTISDREVAERIQTPRSQYIKGHDLWAAIDESNFPAPRPLARRVSPGGRKRSTGAGAQRKAGGKT